MRGHGDSFRSFAGIASLFLVGVLALTWPLAPRITNALPANLGDPLLNSIILGWNAQWLTGTRHGGFWDAPIFHPHDNALAYSEHLIGQTLFVWPVFAATDNAVLTYNVALLASFALCGSACYLWIHALTGRRDVALVFAAAVTFSPFRMGGQLSRLQMLSIGWLPLALWAIHRYGETTRVRYLAVVVASLTLLILSNMYMLFLAALPVGLLIVSVLAAERGQRWRLALGFSGGLAAVALLLLPVVQPYRALNARMGLVHDDEHAARVLGAPALLCVGAHEQPAAAVGAHRDHRRSGAVSRPGPAAARSSSLPHAASVAASTKVAGDRRCCTARSAASRCSSRSVLRPGAPMGT